MARRSAISTTNAEAGVPVKAYATLRVAGDNLVPDQVTRILKLVPTTAYAKGETYAAGPRSPNLVGRTGVWFFSTDGVVASERLADHLAFIERTLAGQSRDLAPIPALGQLLLRQRLHAVVTCFWQGTPGARRPTIPRSLSSLLRQVPAALETDFDNDAAADRHAA